MPKKVSAKKEKNWFVRSLEILFNMVKYVIRAEKGATGVVNIIGVILLGLTGVIHGDSFNEWGFLVFFSLIMSASFSDALSHAKK